MSGFAFFPDQYVDSVKAVDYDRLKSEGKTALLFDIDNTLTPHGADSDSDVDAFVKGLMDAGFKVLLLSNNNRQRIERFNRNIGAPYIAESGKPSVTAFTSALKALGVTAPRAVMIGDSLFTDIKGAKKAGIHAILVKYIGHEKKEWKGYRRYAEYFILLFYRLFRLLKNY